MRRKKYKKIKKPSYTRLLLINLLIYTFVACFILILLDNGYRWFMPDSSEAFENEVMEVATNYVVSGKSQFYEEQLEYYTTKQCLYGNTLALTIDGELFIDTSNTFGFYNYYIEELPKYYYAKWTPELNENYERISAYFYKQLLNTRYEMFPLEIYANEEEGIYYLGKVQIYREHVQRDSGEYKNLVEEVDLTPKDSSLLTGMKHIEIPNINDLIKEHKYIQGFVSGYEEYTGGVGTGFETDNGYSFIEIRISNQMEYYQSAYYSKIILRSLFVGILLFSFGTAYVVYVKRKAIYDTFEYRRKTTEAMAHDLKTPFAITKLYVDNLKQSLKVGNGKAEEHADKIEESVDYMNKLVSDILQFSNSENANGKLSKTSIDVKEEIQKYLKIVEPELNKRGMTTKITGEGKRNTDSDLWNQSIKNLIDNAIKYGSDKATIAIDISDRILVITNDVDKDIENPTRLIEAFVKGNAGRGENSGSGLGLSIADNNMKRLGFKMKVKCSDKKFTVTIQ